MSLAADALQDRLVGRQSPLLNLALDGGVPQNAETAAKIGGLCGRSVSPRAGASTLPIILTLNDSVNEAPPSIITRPDGSSRTIQKSYWSQGLFTGIYYLFEYWFLLDAKSRGVMDTIYLTVQASIENNAELDIGALTRLILAGCSEDSVILDVVEAHFGMVQHAFGYTDQAYELLLALHVDRRVSGNMCFLDFLVRCVIGDSILHVISNNLFSQTSNSIDARQHSCFEYLQDFVTMAKVHSFYEKMQFVFGGNVSCAELIATRALAIVKAYQIKMMDGLSEVFQVFSDGPIGDNALRLLHRSFDQQLAIYLVRDESDQRILIQIFERFLVLDASNFLDFAVFVKNNQAAVQNLVESAVTRASDSIGMSTVLKLNAMLEVVRTANDQMVHVIQKIIEKVSQRDSNFSAIMIAAIFTSLETSIREDDLAKGITRIQSEVIGTACLKGFKLIQCYLSSLQASVIANELIFWSVLGSLPGSLPVGNELPAEAWDDDFLAIRLAPLLERLSVESVLTALDERASDFNRICGVLNVLALNEYLKKLTPQP